MTKMKLNNINQIPQILSSSKCPDQDLTSMQSGKRWYNKVSIIYESLMEELAIKILRRKT